MLINDTFRRNLRRRRELLGMTQADAASCCGMSPSQYADIEQGKRSGITLQTADRVAAAVSTSVVSLLSDVVTSLELIDG